jgi:hypothetical protein
MELHYKDGRRQFGYKNIDIGIPVLWFVRQYCQVCLYRDADKSLAFPIFSTIKRIFLGWVKEV